MTAILGNGIYSYAEAAHLLGVHYQQVSGWFRSPSKFGPILPPDYSDLTSVPAISFLDLIEASVALHLKRHSVTPHRIRELHARLSSMWSTEHPFCRRELYVDDSGRRIFSHSGDNEGYFLEVLENQHAIPEVLLPLLNRVEYSPETSLANKLWLMKDQEVILDPKRRYGKPIVESSGMPTSILHECYLANGKNYEFVADWYSVGVDEVKQAVRFESTFSGIAA